MNTYIVASARVVDQKGSLEETQSLMRKASRLNLTIETLEIVDLATRWEDKLKPNQFKSGASAMAAIEKGRKLLSSKKADLIVIRGSDFLKTGYESKEARENYMKLYNKKFTPMDGYDRLVPLFLKYHKLSSSDYFTIRDALFANYQKTWNKINPEARQPDEKWFQPLTKYFRGVDCANPNVDYSAEIILTSEPVAQLLKVPMKKRVRIIGNSFTKLNVDGFESLPKIAPYLHLKRAIARAEAQAKIDFKSEFFKGRALLDAYTCYPVVPMGLILRLGLVRNLKEIPELLNNYPVTVTGGLNLARAPWNLTSLSSIIVMSEKLKTERHYKIGLVHGNGSLGNQQGITILAHS